MAANTNTANNLTIGGMLLTIVLSLGGSWLASSNKMTEVTTTQTHMEKTITVMKEDIKNISQASTENTKTAAITNEVVVRLNITLDKIDTTLGNINNTVIQNSVRLDNLEKNGNKK